MGQKWKGGGVLIYGHLSLPARAECYGGVQKPTSYLEKKKMNQGSFQNPRVGKNGYRVVMNTVCKNKSLQSDCLAVNPSSVAG